LLAAGLIAVFLVTVPPETGAKGITGKFQIITAGEDLAYLVDTETGAVWVLTFRTLATGREPVAIPVKFIKISPQNRGEFLVEALPGMLMPPVEKRQP
jgi:hypothetical protein